jgi:hypothetical protein
MVESYVRTFKRWQQIRQHADESGLYDERLKINPVYALEAQLANQVKQQYRAIENTIAERIRAARIGQSAGSGATPGTRQKPAREGIKHNGPKTPSSISWLDEARKKVEKSE